MHVTLHVMDARPLAGREAEVRSVVAGRYALQVKHELTRLEALAGGMLAREVLGVAETSQIETNEHGKPSLVGGGPAFNLSNDEGLVVLGVLDEGTGPIGVDVNEVPHSLDKPSLSVARKYFRPEEVEALGDGSNAAACVVFARAWGALEAPLKAMGTGFDFDVRHHREALDEWQLTTLGLELPESAGTDRRRFVVVVAGHEAPSLTVCLHDTLADLAAL